MITPMNNYTVPNDYRNYLAHYGVKGMKWGVRRYQKYDGSYTQEGLRRFNKRLKTHEENVQKLKEAKKEHRNISTRDEERINSSAKIAEAKKNVKESKKLLEKTYKNLKHDKMADQGRKLYSEGKTITKSPNKYFAAASLTAAHLVVTWSNLPTKSLVAIGGGSILASGIVMTREYRNRRLREFYAHKQV